MTTNSSATVREHTPHSINSLSNNTRDDLRRRVESVIQDQLIDADSRAIIRYALEINDPMLSELVQWADAGESIVDNLAAADETENDSAEHRVEALAEMICHGDDHDTRATALLVPLAALESADDPKSLAKTAKHCAFTRCGEMNVFGMVDVQIAMLVRELFMPNSRLS